MAEQRTEQQVQSDLDTLANELNNQEVEDFDAYKTRQKELTKELAEIQASAQVAQMQVQMTKDRNERVYSDTLQKHFGVSVEDLKRDNSKSTLKTKFFESVIFSHVNELAEVSARGETAVREWMDKIADMVSKEIDQYQGADQKAAPEGDADDSDEKPERPEPTDITDIPDDNAAAGDNEPLTQGGKHFLRMLQGEPITELEHALIGRDVEINPVYDDPGLPIKDMSMMWRRPNV